MDNIVRYIKRELSLIGKVPLCNERRDRGIIIRGFCLPICTRCAFVIIGALIGTILESVLLPYYRALPIIIQLLIIIVFQIPMFVDGVAQYGFYFESTNKRRAITGFICGFGIIFLCDTVIRIFK